MKLKSNRHAIIDPQTGLVCNIIVWEGAEFIPPRNHYVVKDCDGQMGDYWHQDEDCFYTADGKRRFRDERGKIGEQELDDHEKEHILPRLEEIYAHATKKYKWKRIDDVTFKDMPIPKLVEPHLEK